MNIISICCYCSEIPKFDFHEGHSGEKLGSSGKKTLPLCKESSRLILYNSSAFSSAVYEEGCDWKVL
jgi:hypothetical protein